MSRLRPTLVDSDGTSFCPRGATAYLMIYNAVREKPGLIHGELHDRHGASCAIGSYFDTNDKSALPNALIDEIAAINDSMPRATPRLRRLRMMKWLRCRLKQLGFAP